MLQLEKKWLDQGSMVSIALHSCGHGNSRHALALPISSTPHPKPFIQGSWQCLGCGLHWPDCWTLRKWQHNLQGGMPVGDDGIERHVCITNIEGNTSREPTKTQRNKGKSVGNPYTLNCFVCHCYQFHGVQKQQTTSWWCLRCQMPLRRLDQSVENTIRTNSSLNKHIHSEDPVLGCLKKHARGTPVPKCLHI